MNRFVTRLGFVWVFVIATGIASPAAAQMGWQVGAVQIKGNQRIDSEAIRRQLVSKPGTVTQESISKDTKTLYNLGFFDQVSVEAVGPADSRTLVFKVVEKPVVRKIFISGNKEVKEDELNDVIKFDTSRFLDKSKVNLLLQRAVAFFQSRGFYDAKVDYAAVPVGDNQVDVTFKVQEGERYRVRNVAIRGLQELDEDDVKEALQTKRYKWWSSWLFGTGRLSEESLDADKVAVKAFLLDNGYLDGTVADPAIDKRDDGLYVTFDVDEGSQYKIGAVRAQGDLIEKSQEKTLEGIESEAGEIFNATKVRNDIFTITDKFGDQGYAFANVVPNTNQRKSEKMVDLIFEVAKGEKVNINRINISGNEKTYDNVIRRELKVAEQEQYSSSKIKRSQTVLQRLGYFDEATVTTQPTNDPKKVDLDVNVREGQTGSFSVGAGYSTSDGALFNTKISENNLFGTGKRINLNLDFGTERNNQILSYDDPRVADTKLSWGVDALRTDREYSDFTRELVGGATTLGYPAEEVFGEWAEDITFSTKYDYSRIDITAVDKASAAPLVLASEGRSTSSSVTPSIIRNTINNPLNPSKGSKQILSFEVAGLGGNEDFYLVEARNQWYYPMVESEYGDLVFSIRTQVGYGESNTDRPFPLFRRYFPGGINSVRGFKNRTLGPKDEDGNEFGGSKQFINNAEVIFPLINSAGIKGVVFYDIGNAFDDEESIDFGEMREAYGYGIRWASPLGPIRVEFGHPVDREPGERSMVTMFSIGAPL